VTVSAPVRRLLARFPLVWQVRIALGTGLVLNNLVGSVVLFVLAARVLPLPDIADEEDLRADNLAMTGAALVLGTGVIMLACRQMTTRLVQWVLEEREPHDEERLAILQAPGRLFGIHAVLWAVGATIFGFSNGRAVDATFGTIMAVGVGLSGLTVSALAFLVAERVLRPLARQALATGVPERMLVPSVASRSIAAWSLSSGVALLGVGIAGIATFARRDEVTVTELAVVMVALGGVGFVAGASTNVLAARASSDPVRSLRRAVSRVSEGDLSAQVDIYDGTELGILQAGFNEMVEGLRERETIRDLFGRHVGTDVARAALESDVRLGGEVRDVTVLFVDIIGSTTLATERPPEEVVALLNRFFDVVIDVVHQHDGWINKFEGDAALAIWGAPLDVPRMEAAALRAARVMGQRLRDEVPELAAGIGVSGGPAVAGNVGAAERYEYTVIGDPVNEAARLTGLAKTVPGHVVANARLLERAGEESERWEELEPVTVRGRSEPTYVAAPRP
jgi:adenylate cyclase